jgi:hypothetical protein
MPKGYSLLKVNFSYWSLFRMVINIPGLEEQLSEFTLNRKLKAVYHHFQMGYIQITLHSIGCKS